MTERALTGAEVARAFHEAYERLAPSFGYETRPESAVPWEQVPENNRRLMIAVASEVTDALRARLAEVERERDEAVALHEGDFDKLRLLRAGPSGDSGFGIDITMPHGAAMLIAASLSETLGDAPNFHELEFKSRDGQSILVTVQRKGGKSPGQKAREAEARAEAAERERDEAVQRARVAEAELVEVSNAAVVSEGQHMRYVEVQIDLTTWRNINALARAAQAGDAGRGGGVGEGEPA